MLAPLKDDWTELDTLRRTKWVKVANAYPKMKPQQQQRLQAQMKEWASLTPEQRRVAREKYKTIKKLPPEKRQQVQAQWQQYQQSLAAKPESTDDNAAATTPAVAATTSRLNAHPAPAAARLGRRLGSLCYEVLLLAAILFVAGWIFLAVDRLLPDALARPLLQFYLLAVTAAYFIYCWTRGGQTLPMKTWRIRVVADDGTAIRRGNGRAALSVRACERCPVRRRFLVGAGRS